MSDDADDYFVKIFRRLTSTNEQIVRWKRLNIRQHEAVLSILLQINPNKIISDDEYALFRVMAKNCRSNEFKLEVFRKLFNQQEASSQLESFALLFDLDLNVAQIIFENQDELCDVHIIDYMRQANIESYFSTLLMKAFGINQDVNKLREVFGWVNVSQLRPILSAWSSRISIFDYTSTKELFMKYINLKSSSASRARQFNVEINDIDTPTKLQVKLEEFVSP